MWDELLARVSGPFSFRIVLQPTVALILAIRAVGGGFVRMLALALVELFFGSRSRMTEPEIMFVLACVSSAPIRGA
jgi:hypothetical protein